jgi:DNA polymerase-1
MRHVGGNETRRHVLVDGNNLLRRAYYVFVENRLKCGEKPIVNRYGMPIGLIYGTLNLLSSWLHDLNLTKISIFFDGKPMRRIAMDPDYKQNNRTDLDVGEVVRLSDGTEFPNQILFISSVFRKLGCDIYWHPEEEADDLIASVIHLDPEAIHIIISADSDFFQLVNNRTVVYRPGIPPPRLYDLERVGEYYMKKYGCQILPKHIRMFKAFTGDPSDNIKGVPRLRKKAAFSLCDAENVDAAISTGMIHLSATERSKLISLRNRINLNWELIELKNNVDIKSCLMPAIPDFADALNMCNDLNIPLDTTPFHVGSYAIDRNNILVDDWLRDI